MPPAETSWVPGHDFKTAATWLLVAVIYIRAWSSCVGGCFDGVNVEIDYNNCWSSKKVFESGTVWECLTFKISIDADNGPLQEMETMTNG